MAKKKSVPVTASAENSAPASAGADAKENGSEKKAPPRYYSFKYVAQCDFPNQMAVHEWLSHDDHFRIVWILHDKDTYSDHDVEEHPDQWKNGIYTRKNGDGSESQYRVGDVKPAHVHGYVRCQSKVTPKTMGERFGNYLTFIPVSDSYGSLIYFTHQDFKSQVIYHKHLYSESELRGDMELYKDNCKRIATTDNFGALMAVYCDYVKKTGTHTRAVQALLRDGRTDVLADIRKNAGFYGTFLPRTGKETGKDYEAVYGASEESAPAPAPEESAPAPAPEEPAPEESAPVPLSVAMYGKEDCRAASPVCRCVACGRKLHEISFSHTWASRGELVGVCGTCYKG